VLFLIPWNEHWIIGTTDTDWDLDRAHPAATSADIAYLLAHANGLLVDPLTTDDVVGVYVGLRPLLADDSKASSDASREHAIVTARPGLTLIAGGKYTTYRVMAAEVVDHAVAAEGINAAPSCTDEIPLVGATGYRALWNQRDSLAVSSGLAGDAVAHLLQRYGTLTHDLIDLIARDPALGLSLPGAPGYLQVEVVYAALAEGALHLDDVLTRRLRVSIEVPDRGAEAAAHAAQLMGPVLGWSANTLASEVAHYLARVAAERDSQRAEDDVSADAARRCAPDVRASAVATERFREPTG
jgi:glycerol-3-phosphate dehydrogenase